MIPLVRRPEGNNQVALRETNKIKEKEKKRVTHGTIFEDFKSHD